MKKLNPITHIRAFHEIVLLLTSHRQLTWEMTKRELTDRYAGQFFGTLWAVGHPFIIMLVYIFVFVFVLRTRISAELPMDYTVYLLSALLPWMCFQESMNKSATAILQEANLVKQVIFPIEVLPVKGVFASLISQLIASIILIVYATVKHGSLPWTYLLLPPLILIQTFAMIGVSYLFSSIGVFVRDLKDFVQVFCFVGIFLMPIFYLPGDVPSLFRPILYLNPFSYMSWCFQDVCYFGRFEHYWAWPVFTLGSIAVFYLGYGIFYKLKHMFGNVL